MKLKVLISIALGSMIAGCASTQLTHNTLDLAESTDKLLQHQVLYNIEKFIDSETAIPAQVTVSAGTATTTNTITPSVSTPLDQVAAATTNGLGALTQRVVTKNPASTSLSASDSWSQNWSYAPITDVYQMRRLRALYRYAIDGDVVAFEERFPLLFKSRAITKPGCFRNEAGRAAFVAVEGSGVALSTKNEASIDGRASCVTSVSIGRSTEGQLQVGSANLTDNELIPDPHYLEGPGCIICRRYTRGKPVYYKNPQLQAGWLRWINLPGAGNVSERRPEPGDQPLGVFGHHELFVAKNHGDKFVEFTLFVLAASTQLDATSTSNASGNQSRSNGAGSRPVGQSISPNGDINTLIQF